jgi:hypothetical protein
MWMPLAWRSIPWLVREKRALLAQLELLAKGGKALAYDQIDVMRRLAAIVAELERR